MKSHATYSHTNLLSTKGFTLLEVVVTLALLGLVIGMGAVLHSDVLLRSEVRSERDVFVAALLMTARARALSNLHGEPHGVHIDTVANEYVLFRGDTYDASLATNQIIPFQNRSVDITHASGQDTIVFDSLTAHVTSGVGTYTLSLQNHTLSVSINSVGQLDW